MKSPLCSIARLDAERRMPGVTRHVHACLRCQADLARNRRLRRELQALRNVLEIAPAGVAVSVERRVNTPYVVAGGAESRGLIPQIAAAGAVAATAAGAAVVMAWRRSHPAL